MKCPAHHSRVLKFDCLMPKRWAKVAERRYLRRKAKQAMRAA